MATNEQPVSDLAIPPGELLAEILEDIGMTQKALASRLGRPAQVISEIIHGDKAITPQTALGLGMVLPVAAHIWLGLEAEYRLTLAKIAERENIEFEVSLLQEFPLRELVQEGIISSTRKTPDLVVALRKFFGVSSLNQLSEVNMFAPAFRCASPEKASPFALSAWIKTGEIRARMMECEPFSKRRLAQSIEALRRLTLLDPAKAGRHLDGILRSCGIRLVLMHSWKRTYASGVIYWLDSSSPVIQLTDRFKRADAFWFSLFHEIGHILHHRAGSVFIEDKHSRDKDCEEEIVANTFAADVIIPPNEFRKFVDDGDYSASSIISFAASIGIAPGCVLGRLQFEEILPFSAHRNLITGIKLVESD